jgi:hypothetical protein
MYDVIEPGLKKWAVTRALFRLAGAVCSLKREDAEKARQVVDVMYVATQALNAVSAPF